MKMRIPLRFIGSALAIYATTAFAARVERAKLTLADKNVTVAGQPASAGTTIAPGDTIVTGSRSRAELTLPDGSVARIGQGSSFTYNGSKLVLNQGSALVRVAHKNTTVVTGSRTYTGGPAVVSAEVSKKTDGLYILQGSGKVNGAPLIAGQTSVLDRGKDRTFTFDLQKMVGSSALVTKFPQTPWVTQTAALASIQHQLLTAKVKPAAQPENGGQPIGAGRISSRAAAQDIVARATANLVSTGAAGTLVVARTGGAGPGAGATFQFAGSPVSLGANTTALIKSAAISSATNGGTLQLSASDSNTRAGAGTLVLNGANSVTAALAINGNSTTALSAGVGTTVGTTGGTLVVSGANTYTRATTVSGGTLNVTNGAVISGTTATINLNNSNATIQNIGAFATGSTINYQPGANAVFGSTTLPQQAGQTTTVNGVNYLSTQPGGAGTTLILQPVAH